MTESGIAYVRVVAPTAPHLLEDAVNAALEMEIVEGAQVVDVRITGVPTLRSMPPDGHGASGTGGQYVALILLRTAT
ncbi:MAG: hypothetical protein QM692_08120 [Thermomicrobiales bacterium]